MKLFSAPAGNVYDKGEYDVIHEQDIGLKGTRVAYCKDLYEANKHSNEKLENIFGLKRDQLTGSV